MTVDPAISYINFDLWVEPGAEGAYQIRIRSPHGTDRDAAVGTLTELGARDERLAGDTADPPYARLLGIRQYHFLFRTATDARIKSMLDRCLGATEDSATGDRNCGVRIRIQLGNINPEVAAIPWEFLYSEANEEFLASSNQTPVVRYLEGPRTMRAPEARLPLHLLVAIPTVPNLDVDSEKRCIREALEGIDPPVAVTFLDGNVTRERLNDALTRESIDFLHFIGHGRFTQGRGELRLNRSQFEDDWITEDQLRELVKNHRSVKLVVLNTCSGAETSSCDAFAGLAPQLVLAGVPAVVAMQFPIRDDEAKTFAHAFYQALFQGSGRGSVDAAITAGRAALSRDFHQRRAVGVPVLYIRYDQGVLFKVVADRGGIRPASLTPEEAAKDEAIVREAERALEEPGPEDPEERAEQVAIRDRAAARLRFRTRAILTPFVVVPLVLIALTLGLFDNYVTLGPIVAASPVWFGDPLAGTLPVDSIAIVTTQDSITPDWRPRHAELLNRLSSAGARVVAFDVRFRTPTQHDSALAAAVDTARARGTLVVGGSNRLEGDSLALAPGLVNRVTTGMDCLGENPLLFSGVVPLLWSPDDDRAMLPAFALSVITAWRRARPNSDLGRRDVALVDSVSRVVDHVRLTKVTRLPRDQPRCSIMTRGSRYGEMLAVRAPLGAWRDPARRFDYAAVLSLPPERLGWARDRIVLVGAAVGGELSERRVALRKDKRYGVERHADAIATMLANAEPLPVGRSAEFLLVAGLAALGSWLAYRGTRPQLRQALVIGSLVFAALALLSVLLYWLGHRLLNLLYPFVAFLLSFVFLLRLRRRWLT